MSESKPNWSAIVPSEEGWYWVKYKNGPKKTICPALVVWVDDAAAVIHSARNAIFTARKDGKIYYGPQEEKTLEFYSEPILMPPRES